MNRAKEAMEQVAIVLEESLERNAGLEDYTDVELGLINAIELYLGYSLRVIPPKAFLFAVQKGPI